MIDRREFLIASSAVVGTAIVSPSTSQAKPSRARVVGLKVDYLDQPLGLENPRPRLSWRLESEKRNVRQSAYRILVAGSEEAIKTGSGELWDSGRVDSSKSFEVEYKGEGLQSRQQCWWCVQIWDEAGEAFAVSSPSRWEMGLLHPTDWSAQWLAVEDSVAKADRETGLRWIWGTASQRESSRKFRFTFHLPVSARAGVFFLETTAQVKALWIDDSPVNREEGANWVGEWLEFKPLASGRHVVAIELVEPTPVMPPSPLPPHGLAFFARLELENAQTVRLGVGPDWKAGDPSESDWYKRNYDDAAWEPARVVPLQEHQPWPAMPAMHLRREFSVGNRLAKARLYATALGAYEARLNGRRVGDALLTPEISQYAKRVLYQVYDVTEMVRSGDNVLGLTVGDGWYASWEGLYAWGPPPRRVLVQLELTFADGSRQIVSTGPDWRTAKSPIVESRIRRGEVYDARLEQPGWDAPHFDDSRWQSAEVSEIPSCRKVAQVTPPIRATQILKPLAISQPKPGVYVVDFGQNFTGWCRLQVKGASGTWVELRFAEVLSPSGEIDQSSMGIDAPLAGKSECKTDRYILRGDAAGETFEPHFTYRGFRYVEITGLSSAPAPQSIEGVVIHSDLEFTGKLRVDNPLIQKIWHNIVWSQRSNFTGIPTDNPTREQKGWLADAGIFWDTAAFNMDVSAFTSRITDSWTDDQFADGSFPMFAPEPKMMGQYYAGIGSPPVWGDASIILPWTAWRRYGDRAVIERNWNAMNRYLQFILDANPDFIWRNKRSWDWGDWLAVDEVPQFVDPKAVPTTPKELVATAYWAYSASLLAQMAQAVGRMEDRDRLNMLFERVRAAFNAAFVHSDGVVGNGSQACYVLALKFALLPETLAKTAAAHLAADVRRRGVALTTGIVGTQFILDVLADAGYADLAYGLLLRTDYPSWGYMIRQGATAIWETWRDVKPPLGSAHNQPTLGAVGGFLFRRIVGIDAAAPGFEAIVIRPALDARVRRGGGDYDSIMGRISTQWAQTYEGGFTLEATVPANTSARIHLPVLRGRRIEESKVEISRRKDIRIAARTDHEAVIDVGSGTYRFVVAA